ncbi:phytoene desaturase family protein [Streptomyces seoulensis]|uniref:Pyridine nucleotide-disulfide oxidoreductase domain-containing protein 2 n=1 Tax=Streptomyces seoulensis TaxID=73044 RepID=A0A4P6TRX4_STRSO|nr:NAD(P)/FAD-dependent oxidoreductase [Streptomyces seoulensis]QBJ89372.1 NAD(P)/FAD-dependent oxidoreductase [Streptomyces seoulensis]
MADAVVIGAGPNGLVAANLLADQGWSVEVLEAQDRPGGAVYSDRGVHPDFVNDVFSSFYPLAAASPVIDGLRLEDEGLRWTHAPQVLAHPLADGRCAVIDRDLDVTAEGLDELCPGDGRSWRAQVGTWDRVGHDLLQALFTTMPPVRALAGLGLKLRGGGALRLARSMLLPVRRLGEEEFDGEGARLLLAGNALHADLGPESAIGGGFGWLMSMLGQQFGFPVPVGGAVGLTDALVSRLERRGGVIRCGEPVTRIVVERGRAVAVRTAGGDTVPARRAVLADVSAPALYGDLIAPEHLPSQVLDDMRRFQWDFATFKVDWALDSAVPWKAGAASGAGTVHLADSVDDLTRFAAQIAMGQIPDKPFLLVGQMTTADPTRSPAGTESAWAYTHLPRVVRGDAGDTGLTGSWDAAEREIMADRMEQRVEQFAPGFRARVLSRRVLSPPTLQSEDANLSEGALNGGTTALHQQAVFRPIPGTGRPETPVRGLYLASSSAHPGGGVHGAPGANAARAALGIRRSFADVMSLVQRTLTRGSGAAAVGDR